MQTYSQSDIQIGGWNIDGVHTRIANIRTSKLTFKHVVDMLSKLDIFCLTETHCNSTDSLSVPGYHIIQNKRPQSKNAPHAFGGLAVGVKTSLIKGVTFLKSTHSEYMWFKLNKRFFGLDKDIYICNVYISPIRSSFSSQRDDIFSLVEEDILRFSTKGNCIIIGDFNARTNCKPDYINDDNDNFLSLSTSYVSDTPIIRRSCDEKNVDTHGKMLLDLCKSSGLRIINGRKLGDLCGNFTCFNHRGTPSVIDYALCSSNMLNDIVYFRVHDLTPSSIHCMISCTVKSNWCTYDDIFAEETPLHVLPDQFLWNTHALQTWRDFVGNPDAKSLVKSFTQDIQIDNFSDTSDELRSNTVVDNFYDLIENMGNSAGLVKGKKRTTDKLHKCRKRKDGKWYDKDCKLSFRQLQSLARNIKKQPSNMFLVHKFRYMKKQYKKLLNVKKQRFRDNIFDMLDNMQENNPKAFWNLYDDLCSSSQTDSTNPISPKKWLDHFSTLMNRNIAHSDKDFEASLNNLWDHYDFSDNELNFIITPDEVIKAGLKLKNNKAPGVDGIRNEMLKEGIHVLAPALCILFNTIYTSGKFPSKWRLSTLTVLHKKGDKTDPGNYRGIAVSSNLCKLFCLVLHNRLVSFTDKYKTIPPEQIGFRKGSRTSDHILVLKSLIDKYLDSVKSKLFVCFIDFSKAFDTVWRSALLYKLMQAGIGGHLINIIRDMYSSVSFAVKYDSKLTDTFDTTVGVKQGCILSPMFFNIFTSDIPKIFDNSCDPVLLDKYRLSCIMYADDLVILSKSAQGLQQALDNLNNYCLKWKLSVNINKSNVMIFNKKGHLIKNFTFTYGNTALKITNEYCYLGVIFTPSGSFQNAMVRLKDKALKAYFKVRENLYSNSYKCSSTLFRTLVQPIISYGSEIWAPYLCKNINDTNFVNICDKPPGENVHIKFCKTVLGVHKKATNNAVRGELGSYPILISMIALAIKYWWKLNLNCMLGSTSLVTKALTDNRKLNTFSWSTGIMNVLKLIDKYDIWNRPTMINKANFNTLIVDSIKTVYNNSWLNVIKNHQTKLRTYCQFKHSFSLENYVTLLKRKYRSTFCKLRISCHKLRIEMDRYVSPKLPPERRICKYCDLNEIEDEFHFTMKCSLYNDIRNRFMTLIDDIFVTNNSSENDKFLLIMGANDFDTTNAVASFINTAFEKRDLNNRHMAS